MNLQDQNGASGEQDAVRCPAPEYYNPLFIRQQYTEADLFMHCLFSLPLSLKMRVTQDVRLDYTNTNTLFFFQFLSGYN